MAGQHQWSAGLQRLLDSGAAISERTVDWSLGSLSEISSALPTRWNQADAFADTGGAPRLGHAYATA